MPVSTMTMVMRVLMIGVLMIGVAMIGVAVIVIVRDLVFVFHRVEFL